MSQAGAFLDTVRYESHTRTVVRECGKDDDQSMRKSQNLTPKTLGPLNRSSPKFAYVIRSWISTTLQNFIQIE